MFPLTEKSVRAAFVNASRKEVSDLTLPPAFDEIDWSSLDYLGWRDPKMAKRAYLVVPADPTASSEEADLVGILLRQAEASPRGRAQCSWCQDVRLPNDVVFFSAKRAGAAGRRGDTVGTLLCDTFQCSQNVRKPPPPAYLGYDVEAAVRERIAELRLRAAGFAENVLGGA
ncbi:FBP domain-containing protein [Frondihabitans australicus]|nr:FBP domain-containing protein [Frondihabitans australicus]